MADEAKADEGKAEEVKADGGKAEGGKRSHSPGGGGKVKKPRGARRGGFYGPMRGGPPGWGRPPPPFMEDYDDPGMCMRHFRIKSVLHTFNCESHFNWYKPKSGAVNASILYLRYTCSMCGSRKFCQRGPTLSTIFFFLFSSPEQKAQGELL